MSTRSSTCWALLRVTLSLDKAVPGHESCVPAAAPQRAAGQWSRHKAASPHRTPRGDGPHGLNCPSSLLASDCSLATGEFIHLGDPRQHGRSSRGGKGEGAGGAPGRTKPRHDKPASAFIRFFFPFSLPPIAAAAAARTPSSTPAPPSRPAGRCRDAIATLSRPSVLCRPAPQPFPLLAALTSLRRRGAAPRAPLSSPVPPPAAPWPRPPQVRKSRREGAGEGNPRPAHAPRSGSGTGGGAHARCCRRRLRPDAGKGGRQAAAEGGRERWIKGGREGERKKEVEIGE